MLNKRSKGGNVKSVIATAKVDIAEKCAMIAVEVPNSVAKPEVFKAINIDDAINELDVSFNVKLNRLDGTTGKEKLSIRSLEDFEESNLGSQSNTLNQQKIQMNFLHDFQNELRTNTALQEELKEVLSGEKKERFIGFLKGWAKQFRNPENQIQQLLKQDYSSK